MVKRILFDLDKTLIPWLTDWDKEVENTFNYFNLKYEDDYFMKFHQAMVDYEKNHKKFSKEEMTRYISLRMGITLPKNFVEVWTERLSKLVPKNDTKLISLLKYLSQKYSLVVVTNWFYDQQVSKLKLFGIYKYFDDVITADKYDRKPYSEIFSVACGNFNKEEVIMVGDTYDIDIKGAMNFGLFSYYLTRDSKRNGKKIKFIKSIYELRDYL